MRYIVRVVCLFVGMIAFLLLIGEPTEEVSMVDCIIIKAVALLALWGVFKSYMCTLTKEERREIEEENV